MRATESALIGLLLAAAGVAAAPAEPPGLVPSADGSELVNIKAGVAWARCAEGQQWSGRRCSGAARLLDHAQALAAASARRQADGQDWRLPRAPELQRLAGQLSHLQPAQLQELFPGPAIGTWHWSSSTTLDNSRVNIYDYGNVRRGVTNDNVSRVSFLHGWAVDLQNGQADGSFTKRTALPVRLVRTLLP